MTTRALLLVLAVGLAALSYTVHMQQKIITNLIETNGAQNESIALLVQGRKCQGQLNDINSTRIADLNAWTIKMFTRQATATP